MGDDKETIQDVVPEFGRDIRQEFMLRENSVFLNHGSYGSMPRCVHQRQVKYLEEIESHADIWFRYNLYDYLRKAYNKVAGFMGVSSDDIFLLQNVTKAVNTVVKSYPFKKGDAIMVTSLTYGAVDVTVKSFVARQEDVKCHCMNITFPVTNEDSIVEQYKEFLQAHPDIKLAIIDHITSPTSVVMPVKRITQLCHQYNVVVLVDAAHVPGQLCVDIQDIDADFYTGNLHKWVFCPRSCAFIWMNPRRKHSWFTPLVTSAYNNDGLWYAFTYEGTKDDTPYICTIDSINYFNRIGGMDKIVGYNSTLLNKGLAYLEEKWGVKRLEIPKHMEAPSLRVLQLPLLPGLTDDDTPVPYDDKLRGAKTMRIQKYILDKYDIQVAVVNVGGKLMVRLATQVYNTMEDFIKLGDAVLELMKG